MAPAEREEYLQREGVSEVVRRDLTALLECDEIRDDAFDDACLSASHTSKFAPTAAADMTATVGPGSVLGDFRIESEVGRGGMAVVYRAREISLDRTVAVKVLCFPWMTDAVRQRFQREATAGARLHHDNIVTVYHYGEHNDLLFFAMELIEGATLAEWLVQQQSQDAESDGKWLSDPASERYAQVSRWVAEVASGLAHAHSHDVIHRDIKPSNLILTPKGRVKILDFGVAKLRHEAGLTTTGTLLGTLRYMSPEQLSPADQEVDHRTDIYSLGAMMYELLTLQAPYTSDDYGRVISQIRETEPPPPRHWNRRIPWPLETICLKAMAKEPRDRYQDAGELAGDLENWLAGRPIAAVRRGPLARLARAALAPRNRPAAAMTALLLACAAAIAWFLLQPKPEPQLALIGQQQITFTGDDEYALDPALSGNGRWLAYASDQGSDGGDTNVWLQRLSEPDPEGGPIESLGPPIQITSDPRNEIEPALSPNGRLLAFCTTGAEAAVYLLALDEEATPGEAIRIGEGGRGPKFSPDGRLITWWVGPMSRQLGIPGDSIWIVSTEGGEPRPFCPEFEMASYPVWSPDSKHLLFKGSLPEGVASERKVTDDSDWWVAPVDGGRPARPLGIMPLLQSANVAWSSLCAPGCWTPRSHRVLFAGFSHSGLKLWSLPLSPKELAATGPPRLLTAGGLHELYSGTDSGLGLRERCCYSSGDFDYGIWSLPIDADRAVVTGEIACVAPNPAMDMTPSVATDGGRLVFHSLRGDLYDIWYQEGDADGRRLTDGPAQKGYPAISQDGSKVAYRGLLRPTTSDHTASEQTLRVIDLEREGRPTRTVAIDAGVPYHWYPSSPPRFILTRKYWGLGLVDAKTGSDAIRTGEVPIVRRDGWKIEGGRFSPDGRWIAFSAGPIGDLRRGRIFIAPFTLGEAVESENWLPILDESDQSADGHLPDWSPNGEILYFLSDRDGCRCLWCQRLDPDTKRPIGAPQHLHHFGQYRLSPQHQHWGLLRLSVARNRILLSLGNCTGNVFVGRLEER
jgi:Tol biopolymer transport system component